jgi:hypothetical protein
MIVRRIIPPRFWHGNANRQGASNAAWKGNIPGTNVVAPMKAQEIMLLHKGHSSVHRGTCWDSRRAGNVAMESRSTHGWKAYAMDFTPSETLPEQFYSLKKKEISCIGFAAFLYDFSFVRREDFTACDDFQLMKANSLRRKGGAGR